MAVRPAQAAIKVSTLGKIRLNDRLLKRLAAPASVDSIPSSAMQEDHVSMGWAAARKLRRAIDGLRIECHLGFARRHGAVADRIGNHRRDRLRHGLLNLSTDLIIDFVRSRRICNQR